MNNQQMIQEIRWVVRSKLHNNWILVSIDIMKRKQEYYTTLLYYNICMLWLQKKIISDTD